MHCIARIGGWDPGRRCARGGHVEATSPTDQPLCWQHTEKLEKQLQDRYVGIHEFRHPTVFETKDWHEYERACWAFIDNEETPCTQPAEWRVLYSQLGPPDIPLCTVHADALTLRFMLEHDKRKGNQHWTPWGQKLAEGWGRPFPPVTMPGSAASMSLGVGNLLEAREKGHDSRR